MTSDVDEQVIEAAVGREDGWGAFYVGNAREWWGQSLEESLHVDDDTDDDDTLAPPPTNDAPPPTIDAPSLTNRTALEPPANDDDDDDTRAPPPTNDAARERSASLTKVPIVSLKTV